jgi:catechol 2,3-dioxygenase-like lactoylglutathione lyase family enzyme
MQRPNNTLGLRHLALTVKNLEACVDFYQHILGMKVEWQPDPDNVYLTTGHDNLALHRAPKDFNKSAHQSLDHLGFIIKSLEEVDIWYAYFLDNHVKIKNKPRVHRDGAKSFYGEDPEGNVIQMIYHPPLSLMKLIL